MVIYLDGADLTSMALLAPKVQGFTTNPSLMKKAGINDYRTFAKAVLGVAQGKPVSFEVFADDWDEMERQAREIASWAPNVWVKIPITNTRGESCVPLVEKISELNLNITAVMTVDQMYALADVVHPHHVVSVFAGRIMDTGRASPDVWGLRCKTLWASAREVYHVVMAEKHGYDIITLTPDLVAKLELKGKDLAEYSLETVRQFHRDAAGLTL